MIHIKYIDGEEETYEGRCDEPVEYNVSIGCFVLKAVDEDVILPKEFIKSVRVELNN